MYEIVKANDWEEALLGAMIHKGDLVRVADVLASANSDGTYTVSPGNLIPLTLAEKRHIGLE